MEAVAKRTCYSCHGNMYKLGRLRREQRDCNRSVNGTPPESLNSPNYSQTLYNITYPEKSFFPMSAMPKEKGGYGWRTNAQRVAVSAFTGPGDPDWKAVVQARQAELGRTEDPGYRPMPYYCYWMKRFGILPPTFDIDKDPIDFYQANEACWKSFW